MQEPQRRPSKPTFASLLERRHETIHQPALKWIPSLVRVSLTLHDPADASWVSLNGPSLNGPIDALSASIHRHRSRFRRTPTPTSLPTCETSSRRIAPEHDDPLYRHTALRVRTTCRLTYPRGAHTDATFHPGDERDASALGTWQGIYLFEHRAHRSRRSVALHLIGE